MPVIEVPRSSATTEMDTFITVLSSTITNCETARMMITDQERIVSLLRCGERSDLYRFGRLLRGIEHRYEELARHRG